MNCLNWMMMMMMMVFTACENICEFGCVKCWLVALGFNHIFAYLGVKVIYR